MIVLEEQPDPPGDRDDLDGLPGGAKARGVALALGWQGQ
jgi:hypothetical protein